MRLVFHVHSTVPDPVADDVMQIGAQLYDNAWAHKAQFGTYLFTKKVPAEPYLKVAGLTSEEFKKRSQFWPSQEEVWQSIGRFLLRNAEGAETVFDALKTCTICFFNASEEAAILARKLKEGGLSDQGFRILRVRSLMDSLVSHEDMMSTLGLPWNRPTTREDVFDYFNVKHPPDHNAAAIADAVGSCFRKNDKRLHKIYVQAIEKPGKAKGKRRSKKAPLVRPKG